MDEEDGSERDDTSDAESGCARSADGEAGGEAILGCSEGLPNMLLAVLGAAAIVRRKRPR